MKFNLVTKKFCLLISLLPIISQEGRDNLTHILWFQEKKLENLFYHIIIMKFNLKLH